ncbi:MAG: DUF4446 family protein [Anaerolineae bacterium]
MAVADSYTWYALGTLGILSIVLGILALLQGRRLARVERNYHNLMTGVEGGNLEQILDQFLAVTRQSSALSASTATAVENIESHLRFVIQHVGVVRFNPFADTGGDLSFALAMADANGSGFVLSSLHGRGDARVYIKPLTNWTSNYALSDEELQAVGRARQGHRQPELLASEQTADTD